MAELVPELVEASGEVEAEDLQAFLERIASLVPRGFGADAVAQVVALTRSMAVDDERAMAFDITYGGQGATLQLDIFMDDIDLATFYFLAPPALAALITAEFESYGASKEPTEGE